MTIAQLINCEVFMISLNMSIILIKELQRFGFLDKSLILTLLK